MKKISQQLFYEAKFRKCTFMKFLFARNFLLDFDRKSPLMSSVKDSIQRMEFGDLAKFVGSAFTTFDTFTIVIQQSVDKRQGMDETSFGRLGTLTAFLSSLMSCIGR